MNRRKSTKIDNNHVYRRISKISRLLDLPLFAAKIFTIIKKRVKVINRMNEYCATRQNFVDGTPEIAEIEKKLAKISLELQ